MGRAADSRIERFFQEIKGKRIAFCGIGRSNLPLIEMFRNKGATVLACDCKTREELGQQAVDLENQGIELCLGKDYLNNLEADILFRTPGMKYHLPALEQAQKNGMVVTSEMEVFFDLCPCKIVAVTGSDGKTTTTSILAEMLRSSGKTVHLGGNIGRPLLPEVESIRTEDVAVVELSSFQLISMRRSPDIAIVTNLSPNHLDIHKDMAEYIEAKKNILLHQNAFGRTVLNLDNEITNGFASFTRGETMMFSRRKSCPNGAWLRDDGMLMMSYKGEAVPVVASEEILIPGAHNLENFLAAIAALWGLVSPEVMAQVARVFPGVEHRTELVREYKGVRYYNDSIASSPTRCIAGTLSLFPEKIILIAGGYDKKIPFDGLGPVIVDKVKLLILLGSTADKIEKAVKDSASYEKGAPEILRVCTMAEAVQAAYHHASAGDIVSLSPACASFDLYPNFEARGLHFKQLVNALPEFKS